LCFSANRAHFGLGVYTTTMGFGSDPYQVAVNNWGPNAAQSKVGAGSVDVCINFSGLSGGVHYLGVGPDNRDVLLAPCAINTHTAGAIVNGKGFGMERVFPDSSMCLVTNLGSRVHAQCATLSNQLDGSFKLSLIETAGPGEYFSYNASQSRLVLHKSSIIDEQRQHVMRT